MEKAWKHFDLYEAECKALMERMRLTQKDLQLSQKTRQECGHPRSAAKARFPLLGAYDLCLKCSHLFNILDARGAISVTERVGVIARVRALAVGIAKAGWISRRVNCNRRKSDEPEPVSRQKERDRRKACRRSEKRD